MNENLAAGIKLITEQKNLIDTGDLVYVRTWPSLISRYRATSKSAVYGFENLNDLSERNFNAETYYSSKNQYLNLENSLTYSIGVVMSVHIKTSKIDNMITMIKFFKVMIEDKMLWFSSADIVPLEGMYGELILVEDDG